MLQQFDGIRILDVTHVLAGPFCAWQFALLGADVIKIENPSEPDCARGRGPDDAGNAALNGLNYQVQGTNKRALALDLKAKAGAKIFRKLVETADIVIENYRTGAMDALGLGYDELAQINPRLIYCSLTGFGGSGPRATDTAYDNTIQAASGTIMQSGGHKPGLSFVDYAAGYSAAFAVAAAIVGRHNTGRGSHITCSMYETALMLMAPEVAWARSYKTPPRPKEAGLGRYATADGELMLGAFTPTQNRSLKVLMEREGFDMRVFDNAETWDDLWQNEAAMRSTLQTAFATRTADEWQSLFQAVGLPAERVRTLAEAVTDEQLDVRGFFQKLPDVPHDLPVGSCQFSEGGALIRSAAPSVGQHNDEILRDLGLGDEQIAALRSQGVIP